MAFVYILKTKIGKYYIGCTKDIDERIKRHEHNVTLTMKRLGYEECVLIQEYKTITEARKVENRLKKLKRKDYIDKIVKDGQIRIKP